MGLPRPVRDAERDRGVKLERTQVLLRQKFDGLTSAVPELEQSVRVKIQVLKTTLDLLTAAAHSAHSTFTPSSSSNTATTLSSRAEDGGGGGGGEDEYEYEYYDDDGDDDDDDDGKGKGDDGQEGDGGEEIEQGGERVVREAVMDARMELKRDVLKQINEYVTIVAKVQLPLGGYERILQDQYMRKLLEIKAEVEASVAEADVVVAPPVEEDVEFEEVLDDAPVLNTSTTTSVVHRQGSDGDDDVQVRVAMVGDRRPRDDEEEGVGERPSKKRKGIGNKNKNKNKNTKKRKKRKSNLLPLKPASVSLREQLEAQLYSREALKAKASEARDSHQAKRRNPNRWDPKIYR